MDEPAPVPAPSRWERVKKIFTPKSPEPSAPPPVTPTGPTKVCTEKERLRWEALLAHAQADCESKLGRVKSMLKGQSHAIHAPPNRTAKPDPP